MKTCLTCKKTLPDQAFTRRMYHCKACRARKERQRVKNKALADWIAVINWPAPERQDVEK